MGDSTADNHHDPSEEVLDEGRGAFVLSYLSYIVYFSSSWQTTNGKFIPSDPELHRISELPSQQDLPFLLGELKNDRFGFHPDTSDNLLKEYDLEAINEMCPRPLTGCRPKFTDRPKFTIWIVDDSGFMYQYCRMDNSMILMGHEMVEGLFNYLYYLDRMLWLWPDTREWILEEEYKRRAAEQMEGTQYEFLGAFEFPSQIARGKPKPKKKRGKQHKHW